MMTRTILFLSFIIMSIAATQAQISVMSMPEKKVETYVYDSLINIKERDGGYNYLKGQKLYYVANERNEKFTQLSNGKEYALSPKDMVGKYFHVIDVRKRDSRRELRDPLILMPENSTDTIRFVGDWSDTKRWIVVGHYEKVKSFYEGKELVFMEDDPGYTDNDGLISMETQKRNMSIPKNSIWKCKAVSINQDEDPYLRIKGSRLILILENDELGEHYCYYENSYTALSMHNNYHLRKFLTMEDFTRLKKNEEKRKAELIRKYGSRRGKMISEGFIEVGMTKNMCIEAWGNPRDINKTTGSFGVHEQWVYGLGSYVYFENGVITTIQN